MSPPGQGCICSDDELRELKQLFGDSDSEGPEGNAGPGGAKSSKGTPMSGPSEVWVGHAIVESADKFGDSLQADKSDCCFSF